MSKSSLEQQVKISSAFFALIEFWEASWAAEVGVVDFNLRAETVQRLKDANDKVVELLGRQPVALQKLKKERGELDGLL